jgi:hypothetical protein
MLLFQMEIIGSLILLTSGCLTTNKARRSPPPATAIAFPYVFSPTVIKTLI